MTTFDKRGQDFENKYGHDDQLEFKIRARRNKLLGQWAAEKLGIGKNDWDKYISEVVQSAVGKTKDVAVKEKLTEDFKNAEINITEEELEREMNRLLEVAAEQIKSGSK